MIDVRVDTAVLEAKEAQMRRLTVGFGSAMQHNFNAGPVDDAYAHLHDRWSRTREKLTTGLTGLAGRRSINSTVDLQQV